MSSSPALTLSSARTVSRFLDAMWTEGSMSPRTLGAYSADLTALSRWLAKRTVPILRTTRADLQDFIDERVAAGAPPTCTERLLSSCRAFFHYFMRDGSILEDPTCQITIPKFRRNQPIRRSARRPRAKTTP